jgi:site-specific recombinase XerD
VSKWVARGQEGRCARRTQYCHPWGQRYILRVKPLLSYAHKLGYTLFNAGAAIKVKLDSVHRGATLAKRIVSEVDVAVLFRAAPSKRDHVLLGVTYAGGLRVSEIINLAWSDVLERDNGRVQLSLTGKGGKPPAARDRQLLIIIAARRHRRQ